MILIATSYTAITPENVKEIPLERKISPENIPESLTEFKIFTVWKPVYEGERIKKIPYDNKGNICKWTELPNLMSFSEALEVLKNNPEYGGLQYILRKDVGICSIDYDNVIDEAGNIEPEVLKDLETLRYPYTEISPSGKGLRVFFFGFLPQAQYHKPGLPEFYCDKKPLTITGHHLEGTQTDITHIPNNSLMSVLRTYYPEDTISLPPDKIPRTKGTYTDKEIIDMILTSEKRGNIAVTLGLESKEDFRAAYFKGKDIKDDPSATDFFVINKIAYYTQDVKQIYNIMQASNLVRDKWYSSNTIPEPWGAEVDKIDLPRTYLTRSICKALSSLQKVYKESGSGEFYHDYRGYSCTPSGIYKITIKEVTDPETNEKTQERQHTLLCATPAYISSTGYNQKTGDLYVKLTYKNYSGHLRHKWLKPEDLTLNRNLTVLANELAISDKSAKILVDYFKLSVLEAAQGTKETVYSAIGWQDDYSCFILGNRKITAKEVEEILPLDMPMADKLTKAGTLKGYAKAGKILMKYDVLRAKFYVMMSSLLNDLIYGRNITATHVATSGNLKGDSSYWIMGAFGHPIKLQLNPTSTNIGFQGHMALMRGLPTSVEELTGHPKILKNIQYHTTSGVARTTAKRNSEIKGGDELKSIVCANSETPIFTLEDRLGNNIRNFNLDEPIEEILPNDEILELENLINKNYGHAAEILIQIILQEKDNLMDLMKGFEAGLPEVKGIPENRYKNMCAFITLSGYFCEKMFEVIGISNKDPVKLVSHFMLQNLSTGMTEPLFIKALKVLGEHYIRYRPDFQEPEPGDIETRNRRGFVERNSIAFLPSELKNVLNKELGTGQAGAALKEFEWKKVIQTRGKGRLRTDHKGTPVYKIKLEAFEKYTDFTFNFDDLPESESSEPESNPEPDSEPEPKENSAPQEEFDPETDTETNKEPAPNINPANPETAPPLDQDIPEFVDGNFDYSIYLNSGGEFPD